MGIKIKNSVGDHLFYNADLYKEEGNIGESFFPKNFGHIGKFGNIGHPVGTGGLFITGIFCQEISDILEILDRRYSPPLYTASIM